MRSIISLAHNRQSSPAKRRPFRYLLPLAFLLLFSVLPSRAQVNLVVEGLDASNWPTVRANIYLLNERGEEITGIRADDIRLTENGGKRSVLSLDCPSGEPTQAISSVLTIDVSGSMAATGLIGGSSNMNLARAAAQAWIEALPSGESECAITAFDDAGVVLHDLTNDRTALLNAVGTLKPQNGTNYNAALLGLPAGALNVVKYGKRKRVIVFLTDGLSETDPAPIVAEAVRLNATIFCVTLAMAAPDVLREISAKTGGACFENVTTIDQARAVYRAILHRARGGEPCQLVWTSEPDCELDRSVSITIPSRSLLGVASYRAPESSVPRLQVMPPYAIVPTGGTETTVEISAVGRPIRIERIDPLRVDAGLSIESLSLPMTIPQGESRRVAIRYTSSSGGSVAGRWRIVSDACIPAVISVRAGEGLAEGPRIHLIAPNGGERFRAGENALISWDGVPPETPVRLEYSINAGSTWKKIEENVTGGLLSWRVPGTPSERCLARVSTMQKDQEVPEMDRVATLPIKDHLYALDTIADRIVGYLGDTTVQQNHPTHGRMNQPAIQYGMWNAQTGALTKTWVVVGDELTSYKRRRPAYVEFSPDGKQILLENHLVDANTGNVLWWIEGQPVNQQGYMMADLVTPSFSRDGSKVLLRIPKDGGEVLGVLDARTGKPMSTIGVYTLSVSSAVFSPDGNEVLTGARNGVALWNARTGALVRTFTTDESYSVATSPDGTLIASVHDDSVRVWNRSTGAVVGQIYLGKNSHGYRAARFTSDGNLVVWRDNYPSFVNLATGDTIVTFVERDDRGRPKAVPSRLVMSPGNSFVTAVGSRSKNQTEVIVYDGATGERIGRTGKGGSVVGLTAVMTPDGDRVLWSFGDSVTISLIRPGGASQDISDSLWAIVGESKPVLLNVDFGRQTVGRSRDSVITAYVRNNGDVAMRVESIEIGGTNKGDFALVSGVPPFDVASGAVHPVELRFAPSAVGKRVGTALMRIDGNSYTGTLAGEGIPVSLSIGTTSVDFGEVQVGTVRDTVLTTMIRNNGTSSVTVSAVRASGPDTTQIEILEGKERFVLSAGGSHQVAIRFHPDTTGLFSTRIAIEHNGSDGPLYAYAHGRGVTTPTVERFPDPTTFRTMAVPNAVIPRKGTFVAGSYDLLGLMAGYAVTDNIMILAGGAPPLPDDWGGVNGVMFGAYSIGAKFGASFGDRWKAAVGFQWAQSIYDREETAEFDSRITAPTPYMSISYGDDDRRASVTAGYAFKKHRAVVDAATETIEEFERHAPLIALGGDWRIGDRWKIVLEGVYMKTVGTAPIIGTARWFGRTWALDFGAAFLGISTGEDEGSSFPIAPVVSFVWTLPPSL